MVVAAATAGVLRRFLLSNNPLFPMPAMTHAISPSALLGALVLGIAGGAFALLLSRAVYASEIFFEKHLPLPWMWWPAVGGIAVGLAV